MVFGSSLQPSWALEVDSGGGGAAGMTFLVVDMPWKPFSAFLQAAPGSDGFLK